MQFREKSNPRGGFIPTPGAMRKIGVPEKSKIFWGDSTVGLSYYGGVAQWLEQSAHNRLVPGSSPGTPTILETT